MSDEEILDEWIDHDEGVRVIQTRTGFRYEPLSRRMKAEIDRPPTPEEKDATDS